MSSFAQREVACPACGDVRARSVAKSVNAERSPHLRDAILAGEFQIVACDACGDDFAIDEPYFYVDAPRRQWLACIAPGMADAEEEMRSAFERASAHAERTGTEAMMGLTLVVVRGVLALREKLVCDDEGIADDALASLKAFVLRDLGEEDKTVERLCFFERGDSEVSFVLEGGKLVHVPVEMWDAAKRADGLGGGVADGR